MRKLISLLFGLLASLAQAQVSPVVPSGTIQGNFSSGAAATIAVPTEAITPLPPSSATAINTQFMVCTSPAITSGTKTLTLAGCTLYGGVGGNPSFSSADVGKTIAITGAGAANVTLSTTITTPAPSCTGGTCTVHLVANAGATLPTATPSVLVAWGSLGDSAAIQNALNQAVISGGKVALAKRVYGLDGTGISVPTTGVTNFDLNGAILVSLTSMAAQITVPAAINGLISGYSSRLYGGGVLDGMGLATSNIVHQTKGWSIDHLNLRNPVTQNILCNVNTCKGNYFETIDIDNAQPGAPANINAANYPTYGAVFANGRDNHMAHFNVTGVTTYGMWFGSGTGQSHGYDLHVYEVTANNASFFQIDSQGQFDGLYVDEFGQGLPDNSAIPTGQVGININNSAVEVTNSYVYAQYIGAGAEKAMIQVGSNLANVSLIGNSCNGPTIPSLSISPPVPGILVLGTMSTLSALDSNAGCFIEVNNLSGNPQNAYVVLGGGSGTGAQGGSFLDNTSTNETSMGAYTFTAPTFRSTGTPTYARGSTVVIPDVAACTMCTAHYSMELVGGLYVGGSTTFAGSVTGLTLNNLSLNGGINADNSSTFSTTGTQVATTGAGTSAYGILVNETFAPNGPTKVQGLSVSPTLDTANGATITNYNGINVGVMTIDSNYGGGGPTAMSNYAGCAGSGFIDQRTGGTASNPIAAFSCYVAGAILNAAGATTGTSNNYQFNVTTSTASGAATGGTVINAAYRGVMPSGGSTGGSTTNYGILISGNGGTNGTGTTTNWGIAYTGTADSELIGGLDHTPIGAVSASTGAFTALKTSALSFTGTAPVVSACGTSSIDAHATNLSGTVTPGTAASCTITFSGGGFTTWNHCSVTSQTVLAAFAYSYTLTAITVTATALAGGSLDYRCDGS